MPGPTTKITPREKAVIFAFVAGLIDDAKTAYLAADEKPTKEIEKQSSLKVSVSRWLNCDKVQKEIERARRYFADRDADQRQEGREEARRMMEEKTEEADGESNRTETKKPRTVNAIDYNNPEARRQLYNRIISEAADDPKTQLDAAKLIEQTQRDDRQAAQDNRVQRVYLPESCDMCPLYQKARTKKFTI